MNSTRTGSVLTILVLLIAAGPAAAQNQAQIEQGQQVFAAQKCSICHSIADKGNKKGPLDSVDVDAAIERPRRLGPGRVRLDRIDLDPAVRDVWGFPAGRVTYAPHQHELARILRQAAMRRHLPRVAARKGWLMSG